jgi:hypothetical protein
MTDLVTDLDFAHSLAQTIFDYRVWLGGGDPDNPADFPVDLIRVDSYDEHGNRFDMRVDLANETKTVLMNRSPLRFPFVLEVRAIDRDTGEEELLSEGVWDCDAIAPTEDQPITLAL